MFSARLLVWKGSLKASMGRSFQTKFRAMAQMHLPGFVGPANELKKALHVHDIICVSVNDAFVMSAWGKRHDADGGVRMLADPSDEFVKAVGLAINLPALGGLRAKRFSMIVVNTIVADVNLEPAGIVLSCSLPENYMNDEQNSIIY